MFEGMKQKFLLWGFCVLLVWVSEIDDEMGLVVGRFVVDFVVVGLDDGVVDCQVEFGVFILVFVVCWIGMIELVEQVW